MLRAIFQFFLKDAEFVCSVDEYRLLNGAKRFLDRERIKKYKIIKFRFASKLPSNCINQKCSKGVGSLHIL